MPFPSDADLSGGASLPSVGGRRTNGNGNRRQMMTAISSLAFFQFWLSFFLFFFFTLTGTGRPERRIGPSATPASGSASAGVVVCPPARRRHTNDEEKEVNGRKKKTPKNLNRQNEEYRVRPMSDALTPETGRRTVFSSSFTTGTSPLPINGTRSLETEQKKRKSKKKKETKIKTLTHPIIVGSHSRRALRCSTKARRNDPLPVNCVLSSLFLAVLRISVDLRFFFPRLIFAFITSWYLTQQRNDPLSSNNTLGFLSHYFSCKFPVFYRNLPSFLRMNGFSCCFLSYTEPPCFFVVWTEISLALWALRQSC